MNIKLKLQNIVQADKRGSLVFIDPALLGTPATANKPAKPGTPGTTVAVSFPSPKDAAQFEQGEEYTITITKTKK